MPTKRQSLGEYGEKLVAKLCSFQRCKRNKTMIRLPPNFKCADLICDFCGYLAQVKTSTVININELPDQILGAAWGPQRDRMASAFYFPLFLVLTEHSQKTNSIFYLSADLQTPELFRARNPLAETARRAGWQGFLCDIRAFKDRFVRFH